MRQEKFLVVVVTALVIGVASAQAANASAEMSLNDLYQAALEAVKAREWERGRDLLERLIEKNPDFAPAYLFLAQVQEETHADIEDVVWLYRQALERDPLLPEAHFRLCRVLSQEGRIEEAIKACRQEYERDAAHRASRLLLGWLYLFGRNDPQEARGWFEGLLHEGFEHPSVLFGEGMACAMTGERGRALEIVTRLKAMGREEWASQLEQTLRLSSDTPADWTMSFPVMPAAPARLVPAGRVRQDTTSQHLPFPLGITPIRLKGKIVPLPPGHKDQPPPPQDPKADGDDW